MSPYELAREHFDFPFELYPFQIKELNELAKYDRAGYYIQAGGGKTAISTHHALYWSMKHGTAQWLVVMPPILIPQWYRWLRKITNLQTGQPLTAVMYDSPLKKRRALKLDEDFILMSYGILKNDFEHLYDRFINTDVGMIADEATAIKNIESQNHKAVKLFCEGRPLFPMTGTPVNKPVDAYAYIRLIAPELYRNKRHFEQLHVAERDEYDNVVSWQNLDLMNQNLQLQSSRILLRNVRDDLPPVIYDSIEYQLSPAHYKLYKRIAEERLVEFENGKEINAISAPALRTHLQQIIMNWGEFCGDENVRPAGLDLIEETLEEIGDKKLVVVANFTRTNHMLHNELAPYNAVAIYGGVSPKDKQNALERFIEDPLCRVITLHPDSAGFGLDGLQHVCSEMLMVEAPTTPAPFEQVVKRIDRDGQKEVVRVRVAIAQGTVQVGMFRSLLLKDATANLVQGGYKDLREAVYGQ